VTLSEIRKKIDGIDEQLVKLLNERADLVHEVGLVKKAEGGAIYAPEREEQVLRALIEKNRALGGRLPAKAIRAIYREIMSASLALEKDLTIAYLGPEAAETHYAARNKFGASVKYTAQSSIAEVFEAVSQGRADYGVAPIENSADGAVQLTLEAFMHSDLRICAQVLLKTESPPAARFIVIGHATSPPTGDDCTLLMLRVRDKPGALYDALAAFDRRKISMSKIASCRSQNAAADHYFFVDVNGHAGDTALRDAVKELETHSVFVKVLGTYPQTVAA